jgi:3-isopropylmalate dehydratase small subunit
MQAVKEIVGRAVPLDRGDVDTDQIIPFLDQLPRSSDPNPIPSALKRRGMRVISEDFPKFKLRNSVLICGQI